MKFNGSIVLKKFDGQPLQLDGKDLTLGTASVHALLGSSEGENPPGEEKFKRYELAKSVHQGEDTFTAEEIALIKKQLATAWGTLVLGLAYDAIEKGE